MATHKVHMLLCDEGENCDAGDALGTWAAERVVRQVAVKAGWRCDDTGDWCPDHIAFAPARPAPAAPAVEPSTEDGQR